MSSKSTSSQLLAEFWSCDSGLRGYHCSALVFTIMFDLSRLISILLTFCIHSLLFVLFFYLKPSSICVSLLPLLSSCTYSPFTVFFFVSDFFHFPAFQVILTGLFILYFFIIWQFILHNLKLSPDMCLLNLLTLPVLLSLFLRLEHTYIFSCISVVLLIF